jgi:hypothetical protein
MNKFILFIFSLCLIGIISCSKKTGETAEQDEWPELDSFHMTMAEVFHPLKDSGDVRPITARAAELADEAEKWANAPLPEKVNNDEVKQLLADLKAGTRNLADEIKIGTEDDVIGTRLYELHDLFHKIQEKWYGKGEHHDH